MSTPPLSCGSPMSIAPPCPTRLGPGLAGCISQTTSSTAEPAIHSKPMQQSSAAIGGLAALGQARHRPGEEAAIVRGPMVVFATASGGGASGANNPPLSDADIRARAVRELLHLEGAVSKEALAAKEEEIRDRQRQREVDPDVEFTAHKPDVANPSPVSVPRAIANALHSGFEGARRLARDARFAPRTAWAM